jgi:hypothetical protein
MPFLLAKINGGVALQESLRAQHNSAEHIQAEAALDVTLTCNASSKSGVKIYK